MVVNSKKMKNKHGENYLKTIRKNTLYFYERVSNIHTEKFKEKAKEKNR